MFWRFVCRCIRSSMFRRQSRMQLIIVMLRLNEQHLILFTRSINYSLKEIEQAPNLFRRKGRIRNHRWIMARRNKFKHNLYMVMLVLHRPTCKRLCIRWSTRVLHWAVSLRSLTTKLNLLSTNLSWWMWEILRLKM